MKNIKVYPPSLASNNLVIYVAEEEKLYRFGKFVTELKTALPDMVGDHKVICAAFRDGKYCQVHKPDSYEKSGASSPIQQKFKGQKNSKNYMDLDTSAARLDDDQFSTLEELVKIKNELVEDSRLVLCCEANIGSKKKSDVSNAFVTLVEQMHPAVLIPLSRNRSLKSIKSCSADAKKYISGSATRQQYLMPRSITNGVVVNYASTKELVKKITAEISNPTKTSKPTKASKPTKITRKSIISLRGFFSSEAKVAPMKPTDNTPKVKPVGVSFLKRQREAAPVNDDGSPPSKRSNTTEKKTSPTEKKNQSNGPKNQM